MASSYLPTVEADFVAWIQTFSETISDDPTAVGLSAGDASALDSMTTTYVTAYTIAKSPATRTKGSVAAKDAARANVTDRARQLSIIIQSNPMVTNDQKADLGLTLRKTNKTPVPAPTSSPLLAFILSLIHI